MDQAVDLCGWVHRRRDHGGVIFIDLRDREGLVQVVFDPDYAEAFRLAETVRSEYVLKIHGKVRPRPDGTINPNLATGRIEVLATTLDILNKAETPPFPLESEVEVSEETRLRYRYIDLRRPIMQQRMRLRRDITRHLRNFMDDHGFYEIETPFLTKATPEGARDYLVPSRTHPNHFFALPQSPQLYKQLLMVAGMDRYYQVVRCFRDEDLRADRQPEFTQLDIETSFMDEQAITELMEEMIRDLFARTFAIELPKPFPRLTHEEAMRRYGSDKPDLRIPLELVDVADLLKECEFKVFANAANDSESRVAALKLPGGCELSRKELDELTQFVGIYGAKGLAYIRVIKSGRTPIPGLRISVTNDDVGGPVSEPELHSPILKFLSTEVVHRIIDRVDARDGDVIFFGADKAKVVNEALGALRVKLGHDRKLIQGEWAPLWVVDFPMFEWDDKEQRWFALHHPFTAPKCGLEELRADPGQAISRAYDMVLNGTEIGGGSVRIHQTDMQDAVFKLLGIGDEEAQQKFGFLLNALKYGAPPHGGIAFGMDRLVMLMAGATSIREVMAFPKTQSAWCPMIDAPAEVTDFQLRELGIRLRKPPEAAKTQ